MKKSNNLHLTGREDAEEKASQDDDLKTFREPLHEEDPSWPSTNSVVFAVILNDYREAVSFVLFMVTIIIEACLRTKSSPRPHERINIQINAFQKWKVIGWRGLTELLANCLTFAGKLQISNLPSWTSNDIKWGSPVFKKQSRWCDRKRVSLKFRLHVWIS